MLLNAIKNALDQILVVVDCIQELPEQKNKNLYQIIGVGRHIRHVIDHFLALKNGVDKGVVDYNLRQRDSIVEQDIHAARAHIVEIIDWLHELKLDDVDLEVLSEIDCLQTVNRSFKSCFERELLYLINHTVHHAAYMKLLAKTKGVMLPDHIGIAPSTATFLRQSCAYERP